MSRLQKRKDTVLVRKKLMTFLVIYYSHILGRLDKETFRCEVLIPDRWDYPTCRSHLAEPLSLCNLTYLRTIIFLAGSSANYMHVCFKAFLSAVWLSFSVFPTLSTINHLLLLFCFSFYVSWGTGNVLLPWKNIKASRSSWVITGTAAYKKWQFYQDILISNTRA